MLCGGGARSNDGDIGEAPWPSTEGVTARVKQDERGTKGPERTDSEHSGSACVVHQRRGPDGGLWPYRTVPAGRPFERTGVTEVDRREEGQRASWTLRDGTLVLLSCSRHSRRKDPPQAPSTRHGVGRGGSHRPGSRSRTLQPPGLVPAGQSLGQDGHRAGAGVPVACGGSPQPLRSPRGTTRWACAPPAGRVPPWGSRPAPAPPLRPEGSRLARTLPQLCVRRARTELWTLDFGGDARMRYDCWVEACSLHSRT